MKTKNVSECISRFGMVCTIISLGIKTYGQALVDKTFNAGTGPDNGFVETAIPHRHGKTLVCGNFTSFNGQLRTHIALLNPNGSVDTNFVTHPSYWVRHMAVQQNGQILICGYFTSVDGYPRNRIARLNFDGTVDTSFDPGAGAEGVLGISNEGNSDPFVFQVALQNDGKILITGNFTTYNGINVNGIARINYDGSWDPTFQIGSGLSTWGRSIQVLPNNQIIATGWFDNYCNSRHDRIVLINPDGSPDNSFLPSFGDRTSIYTAAKLANGQYIVAGNSKNEFGLFQEKIRRLNPDGSVDATWNVSANERIETVCVQSDGKILLSGDFSLINGIARSRIARLQSDGTLDPSFYATSDNWGWGLAIQPDSRILWAGSFSRINNLPRPGVVRFLAK
jgi:uncharacterized delta-60 repeat protein